jgi:hypothetical protein
MEFRNLTPFPSLCFRAKDPADAEHHVVAIRVTYRLEPGPGTEWQAVVMDEDPPPLCLADEFHGEVGTSSVRQESDLAPYKPKCDTIVNGSAHAPGGIAPRQIRVGISVASSTAGTTPSTGRPGWDDPGQVALDKSLVVNGRRRLKRWNLAARRLLWCASVATLGLFRPCRWTLTKPEPLVVQPVRYEFAFGGEYRVNASDNRHLDPDDESLGDNPNLARRMPKKYRFSQDQLAAHPDAGATDALQPVSHEVYTYNPIGVGFLKSWWLKAIRRQNVRAPQIENLGEPLTAKDLVFHSRWGHRRNDRTVRHTGRFRLRVLELRPPCKASRHLHFRPIGRKLSGHSPFLVQATRHGSSLSGDYAFSARDYDQRPKRPRDIKWRGR